MTLAVAYGGALVFSGWLLSRSVALAHRDRSLRNLGAPFTRRAPTRSPLLRRSLSAERHLLVVGAVLGFAGFGYQLAGPVGLLAGSLAAPVAVRARQARAVRARRDLLDQQLGEAVDAVAAAVRAGLSVRRAIEEAARDGDEPLRSELEGVVQRLETGEALDSALGRLDRRLGMSDAGLLVTALAVHRRTGGDLPALLNEIGRVIRARLDDRRTIRALTTQARSSGVVLSVLPVAFVALLSGTGGDDLGAFYRTGSGAALLLLALGLQAFGFAWMRWIVRRVEAT